MIIDQKPQTSFIPKKPILSGTSFEGAGVNFFSLIALAVFLVAILLAGGLFAYQYYLNGQLATLQTSLDTARKQFDPAFIATASRLNSRIISANKLLAGHIAPSYIFSDLLQKYTISNEIQFTSFTWNYDNAGNGMITMAGVGKDYTSVALQAREFASHIDYLKNQIFSNVALDQNGNVTFTFTGSVAASVVNFSSNRVADLAGTSVTNTQIPQTQPAQAPASFASGTPSVSGSTSN